MAIDAEAFKRALALFPAGVTVVTIRAGEERHGLTVSAFASVSADPPLVSVTIDSRNHAHQVLERTDATFAVNFLHRGNVIRATAQRGEIGIRDRDRGSGRHALAYLRLVGE